MNWGPHTGTVSGGKRVDRRSVLKGAVASGAGLTGLTLFGCRGSDNSRASRNQPSGAGPRRGGVLRISNGGDPPDFDVLQSATYLTHFLGAPCYNTLVKIDPSDETKILPDLAEEWELSEDGKAVRLSLRRGVIFHNGETFTAQDVKYTLDRIRQPPKGIVSPRKGQMSGINDIEVQNEHTIVIHLKQAQPDFLYLLANPFNVIYPKSVAEPLDAAGDGMKRKIVGTGPFKLSQAIEGQFYELSRFEKYFKPTYPYLDKLQFFPPGWGGGARNSVGGRSD